MSRRSSRRRRDQRDRPDRDRRASTLRHNATARAGAAAAAISGPDVDTARMPTAISSRSARGGRPIVLGRSAAGRGCPSPRPSAAHAGTGSIVPATPRTATCGTLAVVTVDRDAVLAQALVEEACRSRRWSGCGPAGATHAHAGLARLGRRRRARRHRRPRAGPCPTLAGRRRGRRDRAQQGHRRPRASPSRHRVRRPRAGRRRPGPGRRRAARASASTPPDGEEQPARWAPRVTGAPAGSLPTGAGRGTRRTSRTGRTPPSRPASTGDDARTAAVHGRPPRPAPFPLIRI